jgi:hypothetical protein
MRTGKRHFVTESSELCRATAGDCAEPPNPLFSPSLPALHVYLPFRPKEPRIDIKFLLIPALHPRYPVSGRAAPPPRATRQLAPPRPAPAPRREVDGCRKGRLEARLTGAMTSSSRASPIPRSFLTQYVARLITLQMILPVAYFRRNYFQEPVLLVLHILKVGTNVMGGLVFYTYYAKVAL